VVMPTRSLSLPVLYRMPNSTTMKMAARLSILSLLLLLLPCGVLATELSSGVARVEITPPVGYPLGGYSARKGPSTGIQHPLYATVLLLRAAGQSVPLVSCALRSFPSERF